VLPLAPGKNLDPAATAPATSLIKRNLKFKKNYNVNINVEGIFLLILYNLGSKDVDGN
jgi:hypothetical protein